jgi:hypothetical protein
VDGAIEMGMLMVDIVAKGEKVSNKENQKVEVGGKELKCGVGCFGDRWSSKSIVELIRKEIEREMTRKSKRGLLDLSSLYISMWMWEIWILKELCAGRHGPTRSTKQSVDGARKNILLNPSREVSSGEIHH